MRVSVIVPAYNDARLDACLGSLAPQVRSLGADDAEIIVVDNGSRDDILETCDRFADDVVLVREPKEGSYAARNAGLHMARGAVYAFTDADCLPNPDWLRRGLLAFEDGSVQVLTGPVRLFARHLGRPNLVETYQISTGFPVRRYVDEKCFGPTANLWIRASVVQEIERHGEALGGASSARLSEATAELRRRLAREELLLALSLVALGILAGILAGQVLLSLVCLPLPLPMLRDRQALSAC